MKNSNYKFNKSDLIALVILTVLMLVTLIMHGSYYENNSQMNLNKINCDYIAIISSEEDNNNIKNSEYSEKVVPYYYFSAYINDKSTSNLYVIEDFEDSKYTTFADELLIKKSNVIADSEIYIDEEVSKKFNISLNDKINLSFANSKLEYVVTRIYKSDMRNIDGSMMIELDEKTNTIISNYYNNIKKYKGAFVVSNNHNKIKDVFEDDYIDLSNLAEQRNIMFKSKIVTSNIIFIVMGILTAVFAILYSFIKNSLYIKKNLRIDFNSKFTLKSEISMFNKYNGIYGVGVLAILAIMLIAPMIQELFNSYSFRSIIYSPTYLIFVIFVMLGLVVNIVLTNNKVKKFYK